MFRTSQYPTEQYSFTGYSYDAAREIAAADLFVPASEIAETSNFEARQLAQKLVAEDRR